MPTPPGRSTALVHDYLLVMRGAERTFAAMADCYPGAPIYTLLYDERATGHRLAGHDVLPSPLQRLGVRQSGFRRLLPLFPLAAERLPVGEHDLVVSSSSAFAHGVRQREGAVHVCYCHTPFRYAWVEEERALGETPRLLHPALRAALARSRAWDRRAATRVTQYVANSELSRERIARYFDRDATIVHPPVEVERFSIGTPQDRLLIVCELVRHKQVDVALSAARRAGLGVRVVGVGPELERLQAEFSDVAEFLGRVDDTRLAALHAEALATVVPNVEEFGIVAVEAQASGRPVLGVTAGGTRETVRDGETGVLVPPGDESALAEAMRETDWTAFRPENARAQAERFSTEVFKRKLVAEVDRVVAERG